MKVIRIELIRFRYELKDLVLIPELSLTIYKPGVSYWRPSQALRIHTDDGVTGTYVGGNPIEYAALPTLAPVLLGRNPLDREGFYQQARRTLLIGAHLLGIGVVDNALWDLAGQYYGASLHQLLGGTPRRLPCYASTHVADREKNGLHSPEAFADFAEECLERGFRAFKIHPWPEGDAGEMARTVAAVGERVGGKMDLMIDPFNSLRTFADALRVGRACDDYGYLWWEDPFDDGGVSMHAHRKLRQMVKTPLLQLEHVRGIPPHVDFIEGNATDFVRADSDYDGVTGVMKVAHAAEGFGLDVELHGPSAINRQLMTSISNTNYYEASLAHPRTRFFHPPVYHGYSDGWVEVGSDGCVDVPTGPGAGVEQDWDLIESLAVAREEYTI